MSKLPTPIRAMAALAAAGSVAIAFSSCGTAKSIGSAAAKPFKAAGEIASNTAKKANPMRLFKRDKKDADDYVQPEIAEVTPVGAPPAGGPSLNTATPGAQPAPGTGTAGRSSLSLPTSPGFNEPAPPTPPAAPTPKPTPPPTPPPTQPVEPVAAVEDEPSPLDNIPSLTEPVTPTISDDGFIQLTPKLPGEEDLLPPE